MGFDTPRPPAKGQATLRTAEGAVSSCCKYTMNTMHWSLAPNCCRTAPRTFEANRTGTGTHATVHKDLKSTHPDIFRKDDGLELDGFTALVGASNGVHATIDGFYYRLPLATCNPERPPFQNIQAEGD